MSQEKIQPLSMMMNMFSQLNVNRHQVPSRTQTQKTYHESIQQPIKHDDNNALPHRDACRDIKTVVIEPHGDIGELPVAQPHEDMDSWKQSDHSANRKEEAISEQPHSSLEQRLNKRLESMHISLLESMHQMIADSEKRICIKMEQLLSNQKTTNSMEPLELD